MPEVATIPRPYPLAWPPGRGRIHPHDREKGHYSVLRLTDALATVETEMTRWQHRKAGERIVNWEVTTNHPGGRTPPALDDPAASLWFTITGGPITAGAELRVIACDKFQELPQNVRALSLTMERLRLVAEVGAYSLVAAVEGARALPPPSADNRPPRPWREVLYLLDGASLRQAEAAYRALAAEAGEGNPKLVELNLAIATARREFAG